MLSDGRNKEGKPKILYRVGIHVQYSIAREIRREERKIKPRYYTVSV